MKFNLLCFMSFCLLSSCSSQTLSDDSKDKILRHYGNKYLNAICQFRKYIDESYADSLYSKSNVAIDLERHTFYDKKYASSEKLLHVDTACKLLINKYHGVDTGGRLLFPVDFHENISTIISKKIPFSEEIIFAETIISRSQNFAYDFVWSSNMVDFPKSRLKFEEFFIDKNIGNDGFYFHRIKNGFSVALSEDKSDGNIIILFYADALLDSLPLSTVIYIKIKDLPY